MAARERWLRTLNRLELTRRSGVRLESFIVQQAIECAEALGSFELAQDWVRASERSAIELFCAERVEQPDAPAACGEALEPTAVLAPLVPGGSAVLLHGVRHGGCERGIARAIAAAQPAAVALECGAEEAMPGTALERARACKSGLLAAELAHTRAHHPSASSWLNSPGWAAVQRSAERTESLALVSAWACGARVVALDRPKHMTWARCVAGHGLRELDELFAQKVTTGFPRSRFVLDEREAVMASTLAQLSAARLPRGGGARACGVGGLEAARREECIGTERDTRALTPAPAPVVALVGSAHVAPILKIWQRLLRGGPRARDVLALSAAAALTEPAQRAEADEPRRVGAQYGLLDAIFAPSARPSRHLPPLSFVGETAQRLTIECYSSPDMALAVLPRDALRARVLAEQLGAPRDGASMGADTRGCVDDGRTARARALADAVWESLEPVRAARPVNGGPGWVAFWSVR
ncbi:hypothetical protein KFE25_011481 [Diacronema lutheri]|uniref:Uncharacterized protein n=1 Tax=Diacronema lutheri TaxID=2081491 RepID=A0A8J5X4G7_DIALT|nr:hypothetical protein KFE25_011481 [Diacronema lutheri]